MVAQATQAPPTSPATANLGTTFDHAAAALGYQGLDSFRCPRCGGVHDPHLACPAHAGIQFTASRTPDLGWNGTITLPLPGGPGNTITVRAEVPPGVLRMVARALNIGAVEGPDVGFLPLLMMAAQSPQGQQALGNLAGAFSQGLPLAVP